MLSRMIRDARTKSDWKRPAWRIIRCVWRWLESAEKWPLASKKWIALSEMIRMRSQSRHKDLIAKIQDWIIGQDHTSHGIVPVVRDRQWFTLDMDDFMKWLIDLNFIRSEART